MMQYEIIAVSDVSEGLRGEVNLLYQNVHPNAPNIFNWVNCTRLKWRVDVPEHPHYLVVCRGEASLLLGTAILRGGHIFSAVVMRTDHDRKAILEGMITYVIANPLASARDDLMVLLNVTQAWQGAVFLRYGFAAGAVKSDNYTGQELFPYKFHCQKII